MATVVKKCTCENKFQDKEYGKGMRLHNIREKANTNRCTVCGKEVR